MRNRWNCDARPFTEQPKEVGERLDQHSMEFYPLKRSGPGDNFENMTGETRALGSIEGLLERSFYREEEGHYTR